MTCRGEVAHTHLFPGVEIELSPAPDGTSPDELGLGEVLLAFEDGSQAPGEILADGGTARALAVDGYDTFAGTVIPAKTWQVSGHQLTETGVRLRLGRNLRRP